MKQSDAFPVWSGATPTLNSLWGYFNFPTSTPCHFYIGVAHWEWNTIGLRAFRGVLPYKSHIGMCSSKRYGFGAVSVWKREKLRPFWSRLWTGSLYSRYVHRLITSAERKVKDSRREGMYQSWHFWNKIGHAQSVGFRFYLASLRGRLGFIRLFDEVKVEIVRDI